ncbi:dihydropteroate synthase [Chryseotalea sanaruensis]|uniref:dihydropteroate synthase n=1 Tax=Chryseotalea sanaruensis TaxID=2482724 RepID=A0A401UB70_9BACT|nr:dihydropteroate synthase [Chryseotalea sanaruensis]GCC52153.1 dihydropteroate synthase [Chryseotalea sanaruensis]
MQSKGIITNKTLNVRGLVLDLSEPVVMGILNVTSDSFYEGSRVATEKDWLKKAEKMLNDGASILDVGASSSRPGASDVPEEIEIERIRQSIGSLLKEFPNAVISVDTFRSKVANVAVQEGAALINDISGGSLDTNMFETVARLQVPYILMHMKGTPQNMGTLTNYNNLLRELISYFQEKIVRLTSLGAKDIIIDPGFGFAKNIEQNYHLLHHLEQFHRLDKPILVGVSRKSMIYKTLGNSVENSLNGSTVLHTIALTKGATLLRVHDVMEAKEAITLYKQMLQAG